MSEIAQIENNGQNFNLTQLEDGIRTILPKGPEIHVSPHFDNKNAVELPEGSDVKYIAHGVTGDVYRIETSGGQLAFKIPRADAKDPKALEREAQFLSRIQAQLEKNGISQDYLPKSFLLPTTDKPYKLTDPDKKLIALQDSDIFSNAIVMEWLDQNKTITGGFFRMKESTPKSIRDRLPDGISIDINQITSEGTGIKTLLAKQKEAGRDGIIDCNEFLRFSQAIQPVVAETFATLSAGIRMSDRKAKDTVILSENGEDRIVTLDWSDLEVRYDPNAHTPEEGVLRLGVLERRLGNVTEMLFSTTEGKEPATENIAMAIKASLEKANRSGEFEDTVFFAKVIQLRTVLLPQKYLSALSSEDMNKVIAHLSSGDQATLKEIQSTLATAGFADTLFNNPEEIPTGKAVLDGLRAIPYARIQELATKSREFVVHLNQDEEFIALSDTVGVECDKIRAMLTDAKFQGFVFDLAESIKTDISGDGDTATYRINFIGLRGHVAEIANDWHENYSARSNPTKYEEISAKIDGLTAEIKQRATEFIIAEIQKARKISDIGNIIGQYGTYDQSGAERYRTLSRLLGTSWEKIIDTAEAKYKFLDDLEKNPSPKAEVSPASSVSPSDSELQAQQMQYEGGDQQNAAPKQAETNTTPTSPEKKTTSVSPVDTSPDTPEDEKALLRIIDDGGVPRTNIFNIKNLQKEAKVEPTVRTFADVFKSGMSYEAFSDAVKANPSLMSQLEGKLLMDVFAKTGVEYYKSLTTSSGRNKAPVSPVAIQTPTVAPQVSEQPIAKESEPPAAPISQVEVKPPSPVVESKPATDSAWANGILDRLSQVKGQSATVAIMREFGIQGRGNENLPLTLDEFGKKIKDDPRLKAEIPPDQIDAVYDKLRKAFFSAKNRL